MIKQLKFSLGNKVRRKICKKKNKFAIVKYIFNLKMAIQKKNR